jgi:molybdopterin molybdotransferase
MPPFARFESLAAVLDWLDLRTAPLPPETVAPAGAFGRVLAEDIVAPLDFPPFDRAAVDGYAVRGLDTAGAGGYGPLFLPLCGEIAAGCADPGRLPPGGAFRIAAGAPLPAAADAVAPLAYAEEMAGQVEFTEAVAPGENVARRGTDFTQGARLLPAGRRLGPRDLAVLAACGIGAIRVAGRPRARLVLAGAGLAAAERGVHEVFEADAALLAALVARDGGGVETCRRVAGDPAALREALSEPAVDVILVAGGSGEGRTDGAASALREAGELAFHGIALEPARSAGVGRVGNTLVFLLPGEPVACLCAYDSLAGRALRVLAGFGTAPPYPQRRAVLARKIASALGSVDYCRVRLDAAGTAEPLATGRHTGLAALAWADGFLWVPEDSEGYPAGAEVAVFLYDGVF